MSCMLSKLCLNEAHKSLEAQNLNLQADNVKLQEALQAAISVPPPLLPINEVEERLNNKYPKVRIVYGGRCLWNEKSNYNMDIRTFLAENDYLLSDTAKVFTGSDDEKALKALNWIKLNITYVGDESLGKAEFWQFPIETMVRKKGDCEDGAMLLHQLCLLSGIPYHKLRLTAGNTPNGGHAYLTYYYEEKDYWVCLDWCYYPNFLPISERVRYTEDKLYGDVWFSWNLKHSFAESTKTAQNGLNNIKFL